MALVAFTNYIRSREVGGSYERLFWNFSSKLSLLINPRLRMRSEGYSTWSVCLSVCLFVCLSVDDYSRTTGYEAAYERYQQLQRYKGMKNNVAILLKRLRSRDMA